MFENFPLPTDNLYKFLAIFGLLVALVPPIWLQWHVNQLLDETYKIRENIIDIQAVVNENTIADENMRQSKIALEKILLKRDQNNDKLLQAKLMWDLLLFSSALGSVASSIGFALWYKKTQKILDQNLIGK